jgi:2-oxoglutarate ferredoxin oxidoreductase subunit beta
MTDVKDFGEFETAWCPGCGNFPLLKAVKQALSGLDLAPHQVLFVSGIGQAAKAPHYFRCNLYNGLHGRALPPAQAAKIANPGLTVIVESGDGDMYGEGGNHFLAAVRRNVDVTVLVHDNQIYALTKGQASPTSEQGMKTKAQPGGQPSAAFNPLAVAVAMGVGYVARGYVGEGEHLVGLIQGAIRHRGFALVDIFQPCVTFNRVNTFAWFKERCYKLGEDHDPRNRGAAMERALEFGRRIPIGVIYRNEERAPFEDRFPYLAANPLAGRVGPDRDALREVMRSFETVTRVPESVETRQR